MSKRLSITILFVAVAALTAVLSHAQGAADRAGSAWPPHPSAIFNWIGANEQPDFILSGGELVVTTVPTGQWLVINEALLTTGGAGHFLLVERLGGQDSVKATWNYDILGRDGPVGLVFTGGSEVVLRSTHSTDHYSIGDARLLGYFSR